MKQLKSTDPEPPEGSILMLESTTGTAVQRFYSDGKYHSTTGRVFDTYLDLFIPHKASGRRDVFLVYAPEEA